MNKWIWDIRSSNHLGGDTNIDEIVEWFKREKTVTGGNKINDSSLFEDDWYATHNMGIDEIRGLV